MTSLFITTLSGTDKNTFIKGAPAHKAVLQFTDSNYTVIYVCRVIPSHVIPCHVIPCHVRLYLTCDPLWYTGGSKCRTVVGDVQSLEDIQFKRDFQNSLFFY